MFWGVWQSNGVACSQRERVNMAEGWISERDAAALEHWFIVKVEQHITFFGVDICTVKRFYLIAKTAQSRDRFAQQLSA